MAVYCDPTGRGARPNPDWGWDQGPRYLLERAVTTWRLESGVVRPHRGRGRRQRAGRQAGAKVTYRSVLSWGTRMVATSSGEAGDGCAGRGRAVPSVARCKGWWRHAPGVEDAATGLVEQGAVDGGVLVGRVVGGKQVEDADGAA